MPRVSIGLPVYNGERFLGEALDSLLGQTFADMEIIISDNASTDRTQDICVEYAARDPRIRYSRNPINLGAGRNYNLTVELARGEYFKWAAHDDVCAPAFLEKCVAALDGDPGVVVAYPRMTDIDDEGNPLPNREKSHIPRAERGSNPTTYVRFWNLMRLDYTVEEIFGVIRTDVLRRTAMIMNYTDSDRTLLAELSLYGRLHEVPEVLFYHRMHAGMSTQTHQDWKHRTAWFDPNKAGKLVFPPWRQTGEAIRAVWRAPLGLVERLRCSGLMGYWMFKNRVLLVNDLRKGVRMIVRPRQGAAPGSHRSTPLSSKT
jgi:glycosyltransferase involved in cell wall biosynthesis